jgi:hypothetical protein
MDRRQVSKPGAVTAQFHLKQNDLTSYNAAELELAVREKSGYCLRCI